MIVVTPTKPPQQVGGGGCSLVEAIYSANFDDNVAIDSINPDHFVTTECVRGNGNDTILLPANAVFQMSSITSDAHNYMGPTATPIIFSNITIEANGSRLERTGNLNIRAFSIGTTSVDAPRGTVSGTGNLTIRNAHIKGFKAKGGDGAGGGGGGLGAGGAIYVHGGGLMVEGSTFEANTATGGKGSALSGSAGGGGGGLGGNGGRAGRGGTFVGGGGGGGSRGNGGVGQDHADGQDHAEGGGGAGGGTVTSGSPGGTPAGKGGFNCGGDGGVGGGVIGSGSDGNDGNCRGGGGGGGGSKFDSVTGTSGNGGNGNYGGGGGGNGYDVSDAGSGGFGGGGGASIFGGAGGNGGFGAGGGAGDGPGHGGDFGGDADKQNGGVGAGLGGAIFNDGGVIDIRNSTFYKNLADAPIGGQDGGGAIFSRNGSTTLLNSTLASNQTSGFPENGSGIFVLGDGATASLTIRNTIMFSANTRDCVVAGSVNSDGSANLVGHNTGCPGVVSSSDPLLGPFQINPPGNTPTLAIPSNSPAFNAGDGQNCLSTDQRGVDRPQFAACDIGAYEVDCIAFAMSCPPNKTQSNDPGQCGAVVTYIAPTVTGNCKPVCSPASGSFLPIGTTTVNCTADIATCSFTVTVSDTQAPIITCPANITSSTDPNQCSAVVSYSMPSASDNCPGVAVVCSPAPGSTFQKGTTTVNCTATDASQNTVSCSFTVTVNDLQSPSISCPPNINHSTDPGLCSAVVSYPAPVVSDNCPGVGTPICSPPSGAAFPKGTTTVNCSVTDAANNHSVCAFTVTVNDTEAPTITCPANLNARTSSVNDICAVVNFSLLAQDNCPGVTVSCNPASGSCLPLGTTSVTCTATDTSTNTTHCAFTVTVFNVCLQDDANPALGFLGNSSTGEYLLCAGGSTFTGIAEVLRKGNVITFQQNAEDRRVLAKDDEGVFRGTASLQAPAGTIRCTIADRDTRNSVACH
jgi:hypothetical protein